LEEAFLVAGRAEISALGGEGQEIFVPAGIAWMNLQTHYDLELQNDLLGDRLAREIIPLAKAG
jgi:hypothetical protein